MENKISAGIAGMHCASCSRLIETTLEKKPGINSVSVNPLTEEADISYDPSLTNSEEIARNISSLGYHLLLKEEGMNQDDDGIKNQKDGKENLLTQQKKKLRVALPLMALILIAVFWSFAASYWRLKPAVLIPAAIFQPFVFVVSSLILFWLGRDFLTAFWRFVRTGRSNMDTLIGLGTGTAYFYSAFAYLFPVWRASLGLPEIFFFDVTLVVITLVYLGKYLEAKAKRRTNRVMSELLRLQAKTAIIDKDGREIEIPLDRLQTGDIAIVKPGMKIPSDAIVLEGNSAVDESFLTGESLPIDKGTGDHVIGSTLNRQGVLRIRIEKIGAETVLANITRAIHEAQNSKAPIQRLADRVAGIFVPIVIIISLSSLAAWFIFAPSHIGLVETVRLGITCFISVLAIACPCALGLATPTGIMVGLGLASQNGILVKNAASLERFGRIKTIIFDKTGTITRGQVAVTEIFPIKSDREKILKLAATLEKNSEHPLAQAICRLAKEEGISLEKTENFRDQPGLGLIGQIDGQTYHLGSLKMADQLSLSIPPDKVRELEGRGQTVVCLSDGQELLGLISLADEIKPEAKEEMAQLEKIGIKTVILSGDRPEAANYIGQQAGCREIIASVSPTQKAEKVREIKNRDGLVAMVGDGINDAVALVAADVGLAMATGSDLAIASADITILNGDLRKIRQALRISQLTMRKIKQNLFWAFFYNVIAIPLAAGAFYPSFGLLLSPIIAAGAMSFSSVSIIFNTLLMRRVRI